jgi:hypothetical protein
MNDAQNIHTIGKRKVQDENALEAFNTEYPQVFELRTPQPRMPSHIGLSSEKSESVVSRRQKSVAHFGCSGGSVVNGLLVRIPVRGGTENVAARAQRVSAFFRSSLFIFRRSSRRRCFSSQ